MDTKLLGQVNKENAELICAKIREEAQGEVKTILARAKREAEKVGAATRQAAGEKRAQIIKDLERDVQKIKEKSLSSLNLEKKRLVLGQKDKFIQDVLASVSHEAEEFRKTEGYTHFLEQAVLEGIRVIEDTSVEVLYSSQDIQLFTDGFIKKLEHSCSAAMKKPCSVKFQKAEFKDLGVIVNSADRRLMYDNRFLTRLQRVKEEISMELLKESF